MSDVTAASTSTLPSVSVALSVVVPVFGSEPYLGACLTTLLAQTCTDYEIVVVNDCSPGDTAAVIASVPDPSARVRLIHHDRNRGSLHARITGGHAAAGEYLAFVDADDQVEPWYLERLHNAALKHHADMVQCALSMRDPNAQVINRGGASHEAFGGDVLREMLAGKMNNCLWNKLIRASVWRRATDPLSALPEGHCFGDDLACTFHLAMHSTRYAHIPDPGYVYLPRSSSITEAVDAKALIRNFDSFDVYYRVVSEALAQRSEPEALVRGFFEREFRTEAARMLGRIMEASTPAVSGLPSLPLSFGLLGAIASSAAEAQPQQ